jgi:hypothetical protein
MLVNSEPVFVLGYQLCPENEKQHIQDSFCFFIKVAYLLTAVGFNWLVARMPCRGFIIKMNNYTTLNFIKLCLKVRLSLAFSAI